MKTVFILNSQYMGHGNDELGETIMGAFFKKLWASPDKPVAILFYNGGVKLLTKAAGHLDALHHLHTAGVDLIACGTCVDKFQLQDEIAEGRISGMEEILQTMMQADKVITIWPRRSS